MTDRTAASADLLARAEHARAVSGMLRADVSALARRVAETEDAVARTLASMASQMPVHERRLRAMSEAAASQAARERRWASEHAMLVAGDDHGVPEFALREGA
jgi:histidinol dehydrogenase